MLSDLDFFDFPDFFSRHWRYLSPTILPFSFFVINQAKLCRFSDYAIAPGNDTLTPERAATTLSGSGSGLQDGTSVVDLRMKLDELQTKFDAIKLQCSAANEKIGDLANERAVNEMHTEAELAEI